ncbi:MAG: phosphoenolpyruvate-utilizing N-terminal domain-containing protein, partial [Rhodanobacteraceae bacterium]
MRRLLPGTVAASGMALGRARLEQPARFTIDTSPLAQDDIEAEIARLERAIAAAQTELAELRRKLHGALAREVGEFI